MNLSSELFRRMLQSYRSLFKFNKFLKIHFLVNIYHSRDAPSHKQDLSIGLDAYVNRGGAAGLV